MRHRIHASFWLGVVLCAAGCGQTANQPAADTATKPNSGGVAIIDLDEVARQLGRDAVIKASLQQAESTLNQQLAVIQASYQNQVIEKRRGLGEQPTPDDETEVQTLEKQLGLQLQQVRQKAQQNLNQHRSQIINGFRDEVKPIATQVATERGLSLVVPKNEFFVFSFDPALDITTDVVAALRALPAAPAPIATPTSIAPTTTSSAPASPTTSQPLTSSEPSYSEPATLPKVPQTSQRVNEAPRQE